MTYYFTLFLPPAQVFPGPARPRLAVTRQCSRRGNLGLRERIRELAHTQVSFGYRRITAVLRRQGWRVNPKRVYRLYRQMELQKPVSKKSQKYLTFGGISVKTFGKIIPGDGATNATGFKRGASATSLSARRHHGRFHLTKARLMAKEASPTPIEVGEEEIRAHIQAVFLVSS